MSFETISLDPADWIVRTEINLWAKPFTDFEYIHMRDRKIRFEFSASHTSFHKFYLMFYGFEKLAVVEKYPAGRSFFELEGCNYNYSRCKIIENKLKKDNGYLFSSMTNNLLVNSVKIELATISELGLSQLGSDPALVPKKGISIEVFNSDSIYLGLPNL